MAAMAPTPARKRVKTRSLGADTNRGCMAVICVLSDSDGDDGASDRAMALRLQQREQNQQLHLFSREAQSEDEVMARRMQEQEYANAVALMAQQQAKDEDVARRVQVEEQRKEEQLREAASKKKHGSIQSLDELTDCQRSALNHVKAKAAALHSAALEPLGRRVLGLGFTRDDFNSLLAYVKDDAPVIIHLKQKTLSMLVADPMYRNQFETGTSGGTLGGGRAAWEDVIFDKQYSGARADERPKYGCLNMTGDYNGVLVARQHYGEAFMILKPDVRLRTTFTDQDSSASDGTDIATNDFYAHVFHRYTDVELQVVLGIARTAESRIRGASSRAFAQYKEAQVHGPISIRQDVLALSVPGWEAKSGKQLRSDVAAFQSLSACNVMWQAELL